MLTSTSLADRFCGAPSFTPVAEVNSRVGLGPTVTFPEPLAPT